MELRERYGNWFALANKHSGMESTEWPHGFTLWCSTWKGKQPHKLPISSKSIDLRYPSGLAIGSNTGWKEYWRDTGPVVLLNSQDSSARILRISLTAVRWHMDSPLVFGPVRWSPESLKKNSLSLTILPMYPGSFTNLDFLSNVPRRPWQKRTRPSSPDGSVIDIQTLKKSQKRRGCPRLRRRSQLPARSNPLSNMGTNRLSARNPNHRAEEHPQDLWKHGDLLWPIPLQFSRSFQCPDLHRLSGKNFKKLFPPKGLPRPRQCVLPQRRGRLDMVLRPPQIPHRLQSSPLFPSVQSVREDLASYTPARYTQSVLHNPTRASCGFNFDLSKYSEKPIASSRVFAPISIIFMSLYLCKVI